MDINWFTVVAQLINFLILVWLLKRFLYKPILDAVHEREKKIMDQLKDAADKKAIAEQEKEDFKKKNEEFDQQKKELMDTVVAEGATEKIQLIEAAKAEAKGLIFKMEEAAKAAQANENKEIAQNTQKQVFEITRKALSAIASLSLEEQSANTFIKHLKASKEEEKQQFIAAFKSHPDSILVKSAFDLPVKQQDEITTVVNDLLHTETKLQFKTAPGIISGIELSTNGYKVAWSFSEYLVALEENISAETREKAKTNVKEESDVSN
jgi:F-type H+-transporting ATPase subunit b